jgi:NOL1/NOP2/fmu family ribosome biogenesis protein
MSKNMRILDGAKKKKFIEKVSYLGIEKIPQLLIQTGKERIVGFSGSISREEISKLSLLLSVEGIGLDFARETFDGVKMSLDALHVFKNQIKKNIIDIGEDQEKLWFLGKNIELNSEQQKKYADLKGFVAVRCGGDFIGTGKISQDKKFVSNFLPKERCVKPV